MTDLGLTVSCRIAVVSRLSFFQFFFQSAEGGGDGGVVFVDEERLVGLFGQNVGGEAVAYKLNAVGRGVVFGADVGEGHAGNEFEAHSVAGAAAGGGADEFAALDAAEQTAEVFGGGESAVVNQQDDGV